MAPGTLKVQTGLVWHLYGTGQCLFVCWGWDEEEGIHTRCHSVIIQPRTTLSFIPHGHLQPHQHLTTKTNTFEFQPFSPQLTLLPTSSQLPLASPPTTSAIGTGAVSRSATRSTKCWGTIHRCGRRTCCDAQALSGLLHDWSHHGLQASHILISSHIALMRGCCHLCHSSWLSRSVP